jgi:hypothetical protein
VQFRKKSSASWNFLIREFHYPERAASKEGAQCDTNPKALPRSN